MAVDEKTMRHAVFLVAHFQPESNAGAKRISALAEFLGSRGWHVTVITQLPHHPQNAIYDGWNQSDSRVEQQHNLTIIRLRPWLVSKDNLVSRLLSEAYFSLRALWKALRQKPDLYFTSIPYMFTAPATMLAARVRGVPFVLDVRDLTWQYPKAAGKRTFGLDRVLDSVMKFVARRAALVTATTQGQIDHFRLAADKTLFLPNGVTQEIFQRLSALPPPFPDGKARPKVVYVGLFGFNHNLATIIEAARLTPSADFLLVGDGPDRPQLEKLAANLPNVAIWPYRPFEELVSIYETADILVAHFRKNPIFTVVQSAKVWEYMATGRPIIHATEGESVELMRQHELGVTIEPDNPEAMSAAVELLISEPERALGFARRARKFVEEERIREKLNTRLEARLRKGFTDE